MNRKPPSPAAQQKAVDEFNCNHPIGTPVWYSEVKRAPNNAGPLEGITERTPTRTRSEAWLMGGHSAMVMIDGKNGGVALDHIEIRNDPTDREILDWLARHWSYREDNGMSMWIYHGVNPPSRPDPTPLRAQFIQAMKGGGDADRTAR